jgi:radical SAM superfamily enzyme YgiQ (UPF0313 family)
MKKFKVLLVYPNLMLVTQLPNNIATLSACLKNGGNDVLVFDATLYKTADMTVDDARVKRLQVRPFNIKESGLEINKKNMYADFVQIAKDYKPDLIAVSVLDDTVDMGLALINQISTKKIPVIFGGVYATFNAEKLIQKKAINFVCVGEGEESLIELCNNLKNNIPIKNIKNLWIKKSNKIIKNNIRKPIDINNIPFDDFSVFEAKRIFRPMQGKMVASIPINFDRGCPYKCSFCNAPDIARFYKQNHFIYYRRKTIERIREEMEHQLEKFPGLSYFYFNSESFLNMSIKQLNDFAEMYLKLNIPFWCQSRIETIVDEKIKILKEINCDRISVGIEHGNEEFRKKILNKTFTNEQVINAIAILNKHSLKTSVNNIIGLPDETRELIFDTINLNRKIKVDSISGFVFQPYRGTKLREYCINKGYLTDENLTDNLIGHSILSMPQLSKNEIEGLLRTFILYIKLPKKYYFQIKIAEQLNEEGDLMLNKLKPILYKYYFKEKAA